MSLVHHLMCVPNVTGAVIADQRLADLAIPLTKVTDCNKLMYVATFETARTATQDKKSHEMQTNSRLINRLGTAANCNAMMDAIGCVLQVKSQGLTLILKQCKAGSTHL